jgi:hypothetical protein
MSPTYRFFVLLLTLGCSGGAAPQGGRAGTGGAPAEEGTGGKASGGAGTGGKAAGGSGGTVPADAAAPAGGAGGTGGTDAAPAAPPATGSCAKLFGEGPPSEWVRYDDSGKLVYKPINPQGDKIMDFSFAGYRGGGVALPVVPAVEMVKPSGGDDTMAIQAAINAASSRPLMNGVRGAVLLAPGKYKSTGALTISASGVVLRGSGSDPATGTEIDIGGGSRIFLRIAGGGTRATSGPKVTITDEYVPSGARSFTVSSAEGYQVGDNVLIGRPVTSTWIGFMGQSYAPAWFDPGFVQYSERAITALEGNKVTLDIPLSDSFDGKYVKPPGGSMEKYTFDGRISEVGVESLRVTSPVRTGGGSPQFIEVTNTVDAWIRDVRAHNVVQGIHIESGSRRITVEDTHIDHDKTDYFSAAAPFDFNVAASEVLMQRFSSKGAYKIMLYTTHRAMGPNVALDFEGDGPRSHIQPHMKWATGLLVDRANVQSEGTARESAIQFMDRATAGSHHGWAIGWAVAWNCIAPNILLERPPGSMVWAIGCKANPSEPKGMPIIESTGTHVAPSSLYLAQLCDRLGPQAVANVSKK